MGDEIEMKKAACVMMTALMDDDENIQFYRVFANVSAEFLNVEVPDRTYGIAISDTSILGQVIINRVKEKQRYISNNGKIYSILYAVIVTPAYLNIDESLSFLDTSRIQKGYFTIFVSNKVNCVQTHQTEEVVAYITDIYGKIHKINVIYCFECDMFMVSSKMLQDFYKNNLHFKNIKFHMRKEYNYSDFNEQTWLSICGYKVGKNGLPQHERKKILKYIVDEELMSRHEIIEYLYGFVTLREYRSDRNFSDAIEDWNEDINFLREYHNDKQRSVLGKLI